MIPPSVPLLRNDDGQIRVWLVLLAAVALLGTAIAAFAHPQGDVVWETDGPDTDPKLVEGNPTCGQFSDFPEFKIDDPGTGTFDADSDSVTITGEGLDDVVIHLRTRTVTEGTVFDYEIHGGAAHEVVAKGGPNANLYDYNNPPGATPGPQVADDGLHAPINPNNNRFFGLSHVSFCISPVGILKVTKFIDVDQSGDVTMGDVTTEAQDSLGDLAGWEFTVTDSENNVVCELTTDAGGMDSCELPDGTYTVTETNTGKVLGTFDVESVVTTDNPQNATVVAGQTTEVLFGNTCLIEKVFEVTGVPDGVTSLSAFYTVTTDVLGDNSDSEVEVTLSDPEGDGTWTGTAPERFDIGDSLSWEYGIGSDREPGGDHDFVVADGYPDCTTTNTVEFAPPTVTVLKLKDILADGPTVDDTEGLSGWMFHLYRDGSNGTFESAEGTAGGDDTFIETLTTDADGLAENTIDLAPGTYFVEEVQQDNWTVTSDAVQTVDLEISEDATLTFSNAPEARFDVRFFDLTGRTDATINCDTAGTDSHDENADPETTFESDNVTVGTYECTITIIDP